MKKLTILIPAYNCERYIDQSFSSILDQEGLSENDYQVLIINDGSKDGCDQAIDNWIKSRNLKHFKQIVKANGNWGSVTNYAYKEGLLDSEYFTILDVDDAFAKNTLQYVMPHLDGKNDVVVTQHYIIDAQKNKDLTFKIIYNAKTGIIDKQKAYTYSTMPIGKFFKVDLLKNIYPLKEGVSYQDMILYNKMIYYAKQVALINKRCGYYYVNNIGSTTNDSWNENRINVWFSNLEELYKMGDNGINTFIALSYVFAFKNICKDNPSNIKYIKFKPNPQDFKKASFKWLPPFLTPVARMYYSLSIKRSIKKINNIQSL